MRALKALVVVMGVMIVVGVAVIGVTVYHRMSAPDVALVPPAAPAPAAAAIKPAPPATPGADSALNVPIGAPLPQQFDRKFGDVTVSIPAGARVSDFSASGDRVVLRVVLANQEQRLFVVDLLSGNLLGTIKLAADGTDTPGAAGNGNSGIMPPLPAVNVPPRNKSEGLK